MIPQTPLLSVPAKGRIPRDKPMTSTIRRALFLLTLPIFTGCSRLHLPTFHFPHFGKQQATSVQPAAVHNEPIVQQDPPTPPPPAPIVKPAPPPTTAPVVVHGPDVSAMYAQEIALLKRFGGGLTISEPDPETKTSRIDLVWFNPLEHKLSDEDLLELSPALRRMDPLRLDLKGQPITDNSIDVLNRLDSLHVLDLSKTDVTFEGLKQLHFKQLQQVSVTRSLLTSEQYEDLKKTLGSVTVMRL
jgi:hypothetical protein